MASRAFTVTLNHLGDLLQREKTNDFLIAYSNALAVYGDAIIDTPILSYDKRHGLPLLYRAVWYRNVTVTKILLAADANINKPIGLTPLHIAVGNDHQELVELLLANGANPDTQKPDGATALFIAAQRGFTPVAALLIAYDADVNIGMKNGVSPLYIAAQNGHLEIVKQLTAAKADLGAPRDTGATPLYIAITSSRIRIARHLIYKGAPVNAATNSGETALHLSAQRGFSRMIKLLLDTGAYPTALEQTNATPLDLARVSGKVNSAALLEKKTATLQQEGYPEHPVYTAALRQNFPEVYRQMALGEPLPPPRLKLHREPALQIYCDRHRFFRDSGLPLVTKDPMTLLVCLKILAYAALVRNGLPLTSLPEELYDELAARKKMLDRVLSEPSAYPIGDEDRKTFTALYTPVLRARAGTSRDHASSSSTGVMTTFNPL